MHCAQYDSVCVGYYGRTAFYKLSWSSGFKHIDAKSMMFMPFARLENVDCCTGHKLPSEFDHGMFTQLDSAVVNSTVFTVAKHSWGLPCLERWRL